MHLSRLLLREKDKHEEGMFIHLLNKSSRDWGNREEQDNVLAFKEFIFNWGVRRQINTNIKKKCKVTISVKKKKSK